MRRVTIIMFFLLMLFTTAFSFLFVDPNLIYLKKMYTGFAFSYRSTVTTIYSLLVILSFVFYFIFLRLFKKKIFGKKELKVILFITVIALFFSYPTMLSYDIFNYIATAKVLFFYGENPYILMPINFVGDPFLIFMHAANKTALYAPFWIILTGVPYALGFGNFIATLYAFKLINVAFYLASVYLIYKMRKNIYLVSLFALNPLVLFETLISAHNDISMVFFLLLSFYFLEKKKVLIPIILLILSILIKYATLFLIPVFLCVFIKNYKGKNINWEKVYLFASILMFVVFLLSVFREEIYPWYGLWLLVFIPFIKNVFIKYFSIVLSFSLQLRYIPFMLSGTYFGQTPYLKSLLTILPLIIFLIIYLFLNKRFNLKSL